MEEKVINYVQTLLAEVDRLHEIIESIGTPHNNEIIMIERTLAKIDGIYFAIDKIKGILS